MVDAKRIRATLVDSRKLARDVVRLRWSAPGLVEAARPGQFLMLGPLSETRLDPFLNRPFSIHRVTPDGQLDLLVAVVGRGTAELIGWETGSQVDLLGPLGNGFVVPEGAEQIVLVGGGVGVAPLFFLAEQLAGSGRRCSLLYGAASADLLIPTQELAEMGCAVSVATDDGSMGERGFVSQLLADVLEGGKETGSLFVAACGPEPMLRAVSDLCREASVRAQVSLENRMACGTGACMGCADVIDGQALRVCVEGPVFDAGQVLR